MTGEGARMRGEKRIELYRARVAAFVEEGLRLAGKPASWGFVDWTGTVPHPAPPDVVTARRVGITVGHLRTARWLRKRFPASEREPGVSLSHHMEVAALPGEVAATLLAKARAEGWGVVRLRAAVGQERGLAGSEPESGIPPAQGERTAGLGEADEQPKHSALAAGIAENVMALRMTADTVYVAAMAGHGSAGAYHVCRALALGLRTIERDAMRATRPGWKPADDNHPLDDPCVDGEEEA